MQHVDERELFDALIAVWKHYPQWRFGQLVCNVAGWIDDEPSNVWDVGDRALLAAAKDHLKQIKTR